ncbi:hypothetical protein PR048_004761 [Dryococelus australis]|uniref:Uncharacterized protein n=1 Tax=Dryococelus australis TaxID=614101 RepID=A0ABQ9I6B3_9NEOP|nr:hypothetical protein PR048_004761 [Dryococelus australis]
MSKVAKLHHLQSCLKGVPQDLVSNITVIDKKCNVVWDLLEKQYKTTIHVQKILHLSPINSMNDASYSAFLYTLEGNLNALKAIDFFCSQVGFFVMNIAGEA